MTVMDAIDRSGEALLPTPPTIPSPTVARRPLGQYARWAAIALAVLATLYLLATESKARSTLLTVVLSVAGSAAIWIGANLIFNQVRGHWRRFMALLYGAVALVVTAVLSGNNAISNLPADDPVTKLVNRTVNGIRSGTLTTEGFVPEFVSWIWLPVVISLGAAVVGYLLSSTDHPQGRLAIGAIGLGGLGAFVGASFNFIARPEINVIGLVVFTAIGAALAIGVGAIRRRNLVRSALLGAALGWVVGAFGAPDVGGGSAGWTVVAVAVPPLLIGVRAAIQPNLDLRDRGVIDNNSRKWIFLTPALLFAFAMLVVPAMTTIVLSFKDRDGEKGVGFENYRNIFRDENSWNPPAALQLSIFGLSNGMSWLLLVIAVLLGTLLIAVVRHGKGGTVGSAFSVAVSAALGILLLAAAINWLNPSVISDLVGFNLFRVSTGRSRLMLMGLVCLAGYIAVGLWQKAQTGRMVELGSPSMGPLIVGSLLVLLAVFTTFRGTIVNNLWWVVIVTLMSTAFGLAIAVLADGVRFERVAKSIIFMPMAISMVGASVIWRFMYLARDSSKEQTGVINALWVGLGRLSTGRAIASAALVIVLALVGIALFNKMSNGRPHRIGMVGGAAFVVCSVIAVALGRWLMIENQSAVSATHARVTWAAIVISGLVGVGLLALAIRHDALGMAAGLVYLPIAGAVLWGVARVWGGAFTATIQKWVIGVVAIAIVLAMMAAIARALTRGEWGGIAVPTVVAGLVSWFALRYFGVWGGGVGGQEINTVGNVKSSPINFVQESPFNNMFLMVVLIWIQTGFAMVILSAAIKAVPTELIEAAKVDGANTSQVFWRVTLPQIAPTIGVVVTTIIVLVMKVFDIVNVMTNGNFGTQILANDMVFQAFQSQNQGQGAALAILILVSVLPVMIFNIRKMQREN